MQPLPVHVAVEIIYINVDVGELALTCSQITFFGPYNLPLLPAAVPGQTAVPGLSLSWLADWESYGLTVTRRERHQIDHEASMG